VLQKQRLINIRSIELWALPAAQRVAPL